MDKLAITDRPVHDLIRRRWSPVAFGAESVSAQEIEILLEAARWAPSCFNAQPWVYLVARREQRADFARLLDCLVPANQAWAKQAPVLMVALARMRFPQNDKPNRHAYYDLGMASAQLTLQATAMGLFVHQMGGFDAAKVVAQCEVPEGYEAVAAIALGRPGDPSTLSESLRAREQSPRQRQPLASIAFSGRFGAPLV